MPTKRYPNHRARGVTAAVQLLATAVVIGASVGLAARADAEPTCEATSVTYVCDYPEREGTFLRCNATSQGWDCRELRQPWGRGVVVFR